MLIFDLSQMPSQTRAPSAAPQSLESLVNSMTRRTPWGISIVNGMAMILVSDPNMKINFTRNSCRQLSTWDYCTNACHCHFDESRNGRNWSRSSISVCVCEMAWDNCACRRGPLYTPCKPRSRDEEIYFVKPGRIMAIKSCIGTLGRKVQI